MKLTFCRSIAFLALLGIAGVHSVPLGIDSKRHAEYLQRAEEILDRMPVIDGHNDFPMNLRDLVFNDLRKVNFSSDLTQVEPWASHPYSFTDIPRLRKGKVGGQFWVAYTSCTSNNKDSVPQTIEQVDVIKRLAKAYPDDLHFATSAADIEYAIENKKIASLVAIEGGHSIQSSAGILRSLYELGARYLTLTHNCNTPWADAAAVDAISNPIQPANDGLSDFGLEIVDEMNRLGIMVDLSHVSVATMKAALNRTRAPIIFSHSSAKVMKFGYCYIIVSTNLCFIDHVQHIKNLIGPDHVGIGADFDGISEAVQGLEDVSKYPELFAALLETGNWTEEDLEKLAGRRICDYVGLFKDRICSCAGFAVLLGEDTTGRCTRYHKEKTAGVGKDLTQRLHKTAGMSRSDTNDIS
ncbi:Dipeptidase 1 [Orchesella cincta]|uniref:Dipeptidase n=1 Tax=Orchesella cincta TaxID=48709 RepID=A0A1D2MS38_ORCCI|nr:Dipeptidase 1 [Orchesella cincta]